MDSTLDIILFQDNIIIILAVEETRVTAVYIEW